MDYDSRNMLISSDFPLDKIIGIQSGSLLVGAGFSEVIVPHTFTFAPLTRGRWSTSASFDISYDVTSGLTPLSMAVEMYANAENLVVRGLNFSGSSATLYYKTFYLMPSNIDALIEPTQQYLDDFNINTEYNYTKLLTAGIANGSSNSVTHGLGYYPQTEVWWEDSDGFIRPVVDYLLGDRPYARISTSELIMTEGTFMPPSRWHYRIYAEEL